MKSEKSLKMNMILNAVKGILGVLFPLITFPYTSRVLGVTNIGKYNFGMSIVSYLVLIAGLGIRTYAVREGARIREDSENFGDFVNQMFTINIISTIAAYLFLAVALLLIPKLQVYRTILIVLSFMVLFTTLGVDWIYTIFEDFLYITLIGIFNYILSICLLFLFVHSEKDLVNYCSIVVIASVGANLVNFIHCRKYCQLKLITNIDWNKHLKPIMILFAMQIATTIYISSDTTILGFLCDDDAVGIYSVSTKIYSIIKTILSSVVIVSIPRLASLAGKEHFEEYNYVARDIYSTLLSIVTPTIVGIILLRKQIIMIISTEDYLSASSSLILLCFALIFCLCAWFWGQCILVPKEMELFVFFSTLVSAAVNVILNFWLIPTWAENAAAFTTLVAEALAFIVQWYKGRKYVDFSGIWKLYLKICVGCASIVAVAFIFKGLEANMFLYTALVVICSVLAYGGIEIVLKNEAVYSIINLIKKKR